MTKDRTSTEDKEAISFELEYSVCFEVGTVRCYMLRHLAPLSDASGDSFTVHLLADDRQIGQGWTKDDAAFDASVRYGGEVAALGGTCTCATRHLRRAS